MMKCINVIYPQRDPDGLFCSIVRAGTECSRIVTDAATALAVQTKEYLALSRATACKSRRRAPLPSFLPAQLLEPQERLLEVGNIQDRRLI